MNKTVLEAWTLLADVRVDVILYNELERIAPFNPDNDEGPALAEVARLRTLVTGADAVLFSTPEYAHGIPGVLKNALDWLVGSGEFSGKPVALVNASARGVYAQAALKDVLQTMNAVYLPDVECTVSLLGQGLTSHQVATDATSRLELLRSIDELEHHLQRTSQPTEGSRG